MGEHSEIIKKIYKMARKAQRTGVISTTFAQVGDRQSYRPVPVKKKLVKSD